MFAWITENVGTIAVSLMLIGAFLLTVLVLFIAFFPYASGITVRTGWLDAMNWFGNLYY